MALHLFPSISRTTPSTRPRTAVAALGVAALVAAGAAAPTAHSAPDPACPAAYPVSELVAGQTLHGLTVDQGTTPAPFTGEVVGVLEDGIATGLDLILVELSSPALERAGGVWSGMSGSPVYAADGRLVGAVSYGLAGSPSMVTGLTPAADLQALLDGGVPAAQPRAAETVPLPRALRRELAESGAVPAAEAASGLSRLRVPLAVSGLSARRIRQTRLLQSLDGVRVHSTSAAPAAGTPGPIVPGGNVAASLAYGATTAAYVGTVTAVCGQEVLAFAHALQHSGPTALTMHGARALLVQPDPYWGGAFKVSNIGAPAGAFDRDRFAGVHGRLGDAPGAAVVTSQAAAEGRTSAGTTRITFEPALPDLAATTMWAVQDRALDAFSRGTGTATWTVTGRRASGATFAFTRSDRFLSDWDISYEVPWDLYQQLARVQSNDAETVRVTGVTTTSRLSVAYQRYLVRRVQVRKDGAWRDLRPESLMVLRAGTTKRIRVVLGSAQLGRRTVVMSVPVPLRARGKFGALTVTGGNSYGGGEDEAGSPESFDTLLRQIRSAPRNDALVADLELYREVGTPLRRQARALVPAVVDGSLSFQVRGVRR